MVPRERSYHKEYSCEIYQSSSTHYSKVFSKVKVFKEWVKLLGQGHMVKNNGINTRNIHLKYQSSRTHCSKLISKVKVFKKWAIHQDQGQRVKNNGTHEKILSQGKAFTV